MTRQYSLKDLQERMHTIEVLIEKRSDYVDRQVKVNILVHFLPWNFA